MATTRIISMHKNEGKSSNECIENRIDYIVDPYKTEGLRYVTSYKCEAQAAHWQFEISKRTYFQITGREQKNDVIAYQVRQSFKPGEVTPEEANKIGYELARRFLKGKHAFIVATHTDKDHIHNHIIWNSTTLDCHRKWRDFLGSGKAVARLSDIICLEHSLSVIDHPQNKSMSYNKWLGDNAKPTQRDVIRADIDGIISQKPTSFDELINALISKGYEVRRRGKNISVRASGEKGFIRLSSLDASGSYGEQALRDVIAGKREHSPSKSFKQKQEANINSVIDIHRKLAEGKGAGYAKWAQQFNLKQMAKAVSYLSQNGLLNEQKFERALKEASEKNDSSLEKVKKLEKRLGEIAVLQKHILNYLKTRDIFAEYKKSGYSKKYLSEHESEIALHRAAKRAFDELQLEKLPSLKELQIEYASVLSEKKKAYSEYSEAKSEYRTLLTAKANLDALLGKKTDEVKRGISEEHK